jgi:hypothetical protein
MLRCSSKVFCVWALVGAACTAAPEVESVEISPDRPRIVFASVPAPPVVPEPEQPPGHVGQNGECPAMQVFRDAEDLCTRGIMPTHPFGSCERLPSMMHDGVPEVRAKRNRVSALGGSAELFVKHYIGSGDATNETVYLALRGANGYVLLGSVADYSSQGNDVPEFERFGGDATSVEVRTLQTWWEPQEQERRETVSCTLDDDGSIRCNGECPELALAKPLPPLDCEALAGVEWLSLTQGDNATSNWGGRFDADQLDIAVDWLGIERKWFQDPHAVYTIDFGGEQLTNLAVTSRSWVLLHGQVPLISSTQAIEVVPGQGGLFVSSWSGKQERIHRLNIATHELEPVIPGHCGSRYPW